MYGGNSPVCFSLDTFVSNTFTLEYFLYCQKYTTTCLILMNKYHYDPIDCFHFYSKYKVKMSNNGTLPGSFCLCEHITYPLGVKIISPLIVTPQKSILIVILFTNLYHTNYYYHGISNNLITMIRYHS